MGMGYTKKCPRCSFEFHASTGVGSLFPAVYAETVQKAKDGELGTELKNFFAEHKDGAINAELVTLCCEKCGNLANEMDLTMYVPNDNKRGKISHGQWSVAFDFEGVDYVSSDELDAYYTEYARYPHTCKKCGSAMRILKDGEEIICPECKVPLEITDIIMWD